MSAQAYELGDRRLYIRFAPQPRRDPCKGAFAPSINWAMTDLTKIMESFFGGETYKVIRRHRIYKCEGNRQRLFALRHACRNICQRNRLQQGARRLHARVLHSLWHIPRTTPSWAAARISPPARRSISSSTKNTAWWSATSAMAPWAAARSRRHEFAAMDQYHTLWDEDRRRPAHHIQHIRQSLWHGRADLRRNHGLRHGRAHRCGRQPISRCMPNAWTAITRSR